MDMGKDKWIDNVGHNIFSNKNVLKFYTACLWIASMQNNISPIDNLRKKEIDSVIVYGITELGELFVKEAINKQFNIKAIADKSVNNGNYTYNNIPVISINELLSSQYRHEYIVITAMSFEMEIREELNAIGIKNIISLLDLL